MKVRKKETFFNWSILFISHILLGTFLRFNHFVSSSVTYNQRLLCSRVRKNHRKKRFWSFILQGRSGVRDERLFIQPPLTYCTGFAYGETLQGSGAFLMDTKEKFKTHKKRGPANEYVSFTFNCFTLWWMLVICFLITCKRSVYSFTSANWNEVPRGCVNM